MTSKNYPIYELVFDEEDEELGLIAVSFVSDPATESHFMYFSDQKERLNFTVDEDQHIVRGIAMVPNLKIYRVDHETNKQYYVYFSEETIKRMVEKYSRDNRLNMVNFEHLETTYTTDDATCIESFIIDKENGICPKGFEAYPDGSWFMGFKVHNPQLWQLIKEGEFKGFSVETATYMKQTDKDVELDEIVDTFFQSADDPIDEIVSFYFENVTVSDLKQAIEDKVQIELTIGKTTQTVQIYDITTETETPDRKQYVSYYNPTKDRWGEVEVTKIDKINYTDLPYENWNFKSREYKQIVNEPNKQIVYTSGVNPQNLNLALYGHRIVMVRYNDEDENPATGYRQVAITNWGATAKGNEAVLGMEMYGASRDLASGRKYNVSPRCFLVRRMTDLKFVDIDPYDKAFYDSSLAKTLWAKKSPIVVSYVDWGKYMQAFDNE